MDIVIPILFIFITALFIAFAGNVQDRMVTILEKLAQDQNLPPPDILDALKRDVNFKAKVITFGGVGIVFVCGLIFYRWYVAIALPIITFFIALAVEPYLFRVVSIVSRRKIKRLLLKNQTHYKKTDNLDKVKEMDMLLSALERVVEQMLAAQIVQVANDKTGCNSCRYAVEAKSLPKKNETLAKIETLMMCGCGGYVTHIISRCKRCDKHYLYTGEHHWPPHDEDFYLQLIDKEDALKMVEEIKKCPDLGNPDCGCEIHRESERMHLRVKGETVWWDSISQSWE